MSPQTVKCKSYQQIYRILKQGRVSIVPVGVSSVNHYPFAIPAIQLSKNIEITTNQIIKVFSNQQPQTTLKTPKLFVSIILFAIILFAGWATFSVVTMNSSADEALPTFVALELEPLMLPNTGIENQIIETETPNSLVVMDVSVGASPSATADTHFDILDTATATQVEAEATAEVTEAVEVAEATEEPAQSLALEPGGILLADFSADPQRGNAPLSVNITNLSSGNISAYRWDYETDGIVDNSDFEPPTIVFEEPGIYPLTLTIRDVGGNIVQSQSIIEVFEGSNSRSKVSKWHSLRQF